MKEKGKSLEFREIEREIPREKRIVNCDQIKSCTFDKIDFFFSISRRRRRSKIHSFSEKRSCSHHMQWTYNWSKEKEKQSFGNLNPKENKLSQFRSQIKRNNSMSKFIYFWSSHHTWECFLQICLNPSSSSLSLSLPLSVSPSLCPESQLKKKPLGGCGDF